MEYLLQLFQVEYRHGVDAVAVDEAAQVLDIVRSGKKDLVLNYRKAQVKRVTCNIAIRGCDR